MGCIYYLLQYCNQISFLSSPTFCLYSTSTKVSPKPKAVNCDIVNFQYNTLTGGEYRRDKCSLEFYNFEAEDSGDWKVVVAINGIDSASDELTFADVFSTRQADVRLEDPASGDRVGK